MLIRGRRLSWRHPGRLVGVLPSHTTGHSLVYESSLERDFLRLCDFDPLILDFRSQPFQLRYRLDGKDRTYTPDVLINSGRLIEVKPERRTHTPEFARWGTAIYETCADMGYVFEVVTDTEIRRQPRLNNVVLLRRYCRQPISKGIRADVRGWVRETPGMHLGDLLRRLGGSEEALANLYGLLAQHEVRFDINAPLESDLSVFPNSQQ